MKYFLYDEKNRRLVLVDDIYPTLDNSKRYDGGSNNYPTKNSKEPRIYNTLFVWHDLQLKAHAAENMLDHEVWYMGDPVENSEPKLVMILPSNDTYLIYGGAYLYTERK